MSDTIITGLGYLHQSLRLCIDGASQGRIWGRVAGMRLSSPMPFTDMNEFIMKMDIIMDQQNFPQSFQRKREFKAGKRSENMIESVKPYITGVAATAEQVDALEGELATITLRILARRNASWQGHVVMPDGSKADFGSELEMLQIISDVLPINRA